MNHKWISCNLNGFCETMEFGVHAYNPDDRHKDNLGNVWVESEN